MICFVGTIDEFKTAMKLHLIKKGVEKERIKELPFQFTISKFDGIDFIDNAGDGAINDNSLPIENKKIHTPAEIKEIYNNLTEERGA